MAYINGKDDFLISLVIENNKVKLLEDVPIALDLSSGNQIVSADEGSAVKSAIILKPETLKPENIAEGVNIAGIIGTYKVTLLENIPIALDFTNGNQIITAPEGQGVKSAIITMPETLIPENIAEGVNIAGIIGTHSGGGATETDILPLQDLTFAQNTETGLYEWFTAPAPSALTVGETYRVVWNENEHICTAFDGSALYQGGVGLGNTLFFGGADTKEPFLFAYVPATGEGVEYDTLGCLTLDTDATHSVRIYQKASSGSALVHYVTFIGALGDILFEMPVLDKDDCKDPIAHGDIDIPTKESTASETFVNSGWSFTPDGEADPNALKNVTEDRTVYAAFTASPRYYTIRFFDGDVLHETKQLAYGTMPTIDNPTKDGYSFVEWQPALSVVTGDADYYAQWEEKVTFAGGTWESIIRVAQSGQASQYFKVGDQRTERLNYADGTSEIITLTVAGFDYDNIGTTSNKAGISIISNVLAIDKQMFASSPNPYGYYSQSEMRSYLNNTVKKALSPDLQAAIKQVKKTWKTSANGTNNQIADQSFEYLWLIDPTEMYNEARYPMFTSTASSRIAYKTDGTAANYWVRSGSGLSKSNWSYCNTSGQSANQSATSVCGVRFGFCI